MADETPEPDDFSELEAASGDPALLGAEAEGRPAFAVDADGEIVWAGERAYALIGAGELDAATRRTLARMATAGAGGLLRLRLGDASNRPVRFQAKPIAHAGGAAMIGLAGIAPVSEMPPLAKRDVATEEGAGEAQGVDAHILAAEPAIDADAEPASLAEILAASPIDADTGADAGSEVDDARPVAAEPDGSGLSGDSVEPDLVGSHSLEGPMAPKDLSAEVDLPALDEDRPPDPRHDFVAHMVAPEPSEHLSAEEIAVGRETLEAEKPATRVEASEPFRFAFEIDEAMRLTLLTSELGRAVGPSAAAAVGRPWETVAADLGLDPDGAIAAALARQGSWADLELAWPVDDGRRLPLSLSALPMFDRGRSFVGFRGLGRSIGEPFTADPRSVAEEPDVARTDFGPPVGSETEARPEPHLNVPAPEVLVGEASEPTASSPREEPPILIEVKPEPPVFAGNVIALRETPPRAVALSSSEESAFDEIARRLRGLGVRIDEPEAAPDAVEAHATSERDAPEGQRELPFAASPDELLRLIDRLPVGALVLRGGDVGHANRPALDLLGCRALGDLTGRGADTLFAEPLPQDRDASAGRLRLIAANGGEVEVDARLSSIAWGGAPATLVTLRRPEAGLSAAKDIERRERELAAVLDVATDGVMTLDGAGRILSVNRCAETLFGFASRDVEGSLFTLSLAPESRRAAFDCLDALKADVPLADGGVEVLGLSRDGGALPLLMTIAKLADGGDDNRFCAVLRDVGPWKRAEEELIAARRQAERANAQKSEFLAKVGHEIRSPLNAIIGFAEVMMDERLGPIGSPRYKDYLKDIHASGGHIVKMVDDLLDISRIETGKLKLDFVAVDLNEIASQAAALLQPQANRDRVIIRTSLARGLPHVLADRRSVRQIMTNLAANAVKLSRPGGQVIVATAFGDAGQAVFRVRDAGAGMSKQEIARAFEPFRPLAVADNDTGFGLGLPLTRALAEANEAALALQSEVGQGTLAEVTFPASRVLAG